MEVVFNFVLKDFHEMVLLSYFNRKVMILSKVQFCTNNFLSTIDQMTSAQS